MRYSARIMSLWWLIPILTAFALSAFFVPVVAAFARKFAVLDMPDGVRKLHGSAMPLLGGAAPYVGFTVVIIGLLLFTDHLTSGEISVTTILGFLCACGVLIAGGALDDAYDIRRGKTVLFPLGAAAIAVAAGMGVSKVTNPFGAGPLDVLPIVSGVITYVWLMCTTYTTKLLDGVDGVVSALGIVGACMVAGLCLTTAFYQPDVALLSLVFAAALFGFFLWNAPPAKIYLGEGGSTFIGFVLGSLAVISGSKFATLLFIVGLPALDVAFVIGRRLMSGKSPVSTADRHHFHHELLALGLSARGVIFVYCGVALLFGAATFLFESWQKLAALAVLAIASVFAMLYLSYRNRSV